MGRALREPKWIEIFQPVSDPKKNSVRLHIKGENILKFVKMVESGDLTK